MADRATVTRPSTEELLARAWELVPVLRERAASTEELRRVPDETIEDFRRAGFFRVFQPARFGGYEMDYGTTQIELASVLGRGCGSSGWVQSVVACHAWLVGMYPEAAQDAVWGSNPEARIATSFATANGKGTPVEGGFVVRGQWQFSSGVDASDWVIVNVPIEGQMRGRYGRFALLPRSEWEIVDTWFASGLRGSGSKDVLVKEAFVPHDFTIDPVDPHADPTRETGNDSYIFRLPILSIFPFNVAPPALGAARGALEAFIEQTGARPDRAGDAAKQLRIAESAAEIDAAEALLRADAAEVARLGRLGQPFGLQNEVRWKRDLAYTGVLCTRAVDRLVNAVGAHGILEANPIHRASRDVHAIANHIGVSWDLAAIPYGKVALGLDL